MCQRTAGSSLVQPRGSQQKTDEACLSPGKNKWIWGGTSTVVQLGWELNEGLPSCPT